VLAAGIQRLAFPDFHPGLAQLLGMFGTDVEPSRLLRPNNATTMLLDARLAANAGDCRIAVRRWIALGVDPLDLADGAIGSPALARSSACDSVRIAMTIPVRLVVVRGGVACDGASPPRFYLSVVDYPQPRPSVAPVVGG